ncbi:MAG TPA: hypothetical protein VFR81_26390 [Longimicrobium sp.]|nr:hypothetical protein [Longimicrobium sp.]
MARPKPGKPAPKYDPGAHTGAPGAFPYRAIQPRVPEKQLRAYAGLARGRYERLARKWTAGRNAEWMLRGYAALKHLMSATVALGSASSPPPEARPGALAFPELVHRGVFGAARALALFFPDAPWEGGALLNPEHRALVRLLRGSLSPMDATQAGVVGLVLERAADYRGKGEEEDGRNVVEIVRTDEAIPVARFLAELAQLHSELLAAALGEHVEPPVGYDFGVLVSAGGREGTGGDELIDDADARRIGGVFGEAPFPATLWTMSRVWLAEDADALWADAGADDTTDRRLVYPFE